MIKSAMPTAPVRLLGLLVLALLVAACGGGGGTQQIAATPPPMTPPPAALAVSRASIPQNAVAVDPRKELSVVFNQDLGGTLLTPLAVELTQDAAVVQTSVTVDGSKLTVAPASPLKLGANYKLTLKAGFGSPTSTLASDYILSFKTDVAVFDMRQIVAADPMLNGSIEPIVAAGDFNGDGLQDIVELGRLQNQPADASGFVQGYTLNFYAQTPKGDFVKSQHIDFAIGQSNFLTYFEKIVLLDIDGDGVPEVLVPEFTSFDGTGAGLRIFSRDASGNYQASAFMSSQYTQAIDVADVDGDGRADLIGSASSQYAGGFQVFINTGSKSTTAPTGLLAMAAVTAPWPIGRPISTSLNHDGKRQLVVQQFQALGAVVPTSTPIQAFSQTSPGVFALDADLSHLFDGVCDAGPTTGCGPLTTLLDIDGDGFPDLLFGGGSTNAIAYLRRNSTFTKSFEVALLGFPYVTDVNRDGLDDLIIVSNQSQPFVAAAIGTRTATWTFSAAYSMGLFNTINVKSSAAVADFNGDGLPDVIVDQVNSGIFLATQLKQ